MTQQRSIAINPLPWVITPDGFDFSEPTLRRAMAALGPIGYSALQADIPPGMPVERYRRLLEEYGFRPAPGFFSGAFSDRDAHVELIERARRHAAEQAELGLHETFVSADLPADRIAAPGAGAHADPERLRTVVDGLVLAAEAAQREGVTHALHPHISALVETEPETRFVLDATAGTALQFGPDLGHLYWAGADVPTLLHDYRDRIVGLHLKDVDPDVLSRVRESGVDLFGAMQEHIWTEPGRGAIDFPAALSALPPDFDGWFVVEVDVPSLPSPELSSRAAWDYLHSLPFFAVVNA